MLNLALNLAATALIMVLVPLFVPFVQMPQILTIIPTILIIGFMNFLLRPMMVLLGIDLTYSRTLILSLVLNWPFMNVGYGLLDEFDEQSWLAAFFGALLMSFFQILILKLDWNRRKPIT